VKDRTARDMLAKWVKEGFILKRGSGKKDAYYVLSENYRRLVGNRRVKLTTGRIV
jgi:hypothetical protein